MTRNEAKAIKHRARDLTVKPSRGGRGTRVKGGSLKANEVMCQNNLRRGTWITDTSYGTSHSG